MIINLYQYDIGMDDLFSQQPHVNVRALDQECVDLLPPDFEPGKWDVICQRGKECFDHVGNRRFRMCIDSHLDQYMKVKSRQQKSKIVTNIVQSIRSAAAQSGGGFVRKDLLTRRWFKVGDKLAREKVGQALRDAIKTRRASGSKQSPMGIEESYSAGQKRSGEETGFCAKFDSVEMPKAKRALSISPSNPTGGQGLHHQLSDEGSASLLGYRRALQASDDFGGLQKQPNAFLFHNQLEAEFEPTPIQNQTRALPDLIDRRLLAANALSSNHEYTTPNQLRRLYYDFDSGSAGEIRGNFDPTAQTATGAIQWSSLPGARTFPSYEQQILPTVIQGRQLSASLDGNMFQDGRGNMLYNLKTSHESSEDVGGDNTRASSSNTIADWEELTANNSSQLFKM